MAKKMGRPIKEIDEKQFENLCFLQCTEKEICSFFSISDETLNRWCKKTYGKTFVDAFDEKRQGGFISLRRSQFRLAEKNAAMAIFLGKNLLGQTDSGQHQSEESENVNIIITPVYGSDNCDE